MKFIAALTVLAAAIATVGATVAADNESNASRMARGLPPRSPYKRGSPTRGQSLFTYPSMQRLPGNHTNAVDRAEWHHEPSHAPPTCGSFLDKCHEDSDCCYGPCIFGVSPLVVFVGFESSFARPISTATSEPPKNTLL